MESNTLPFVTVMMPVFNETLFIERSLGRVLAQDYPPERMEVLVVDGRSTDNTRELVNELAAKDKRLRLLDNPLRNQADALNVAIGQAVGEFLVRVDGHTEIPVDYVQMCVRILQETGADNVGGRMQAVGHTPLTEAIALATNSPYATGGSRFHFSKQAGEVDTVYMGAFRGEIFKKADYFRAIFVPGEDYEMNIRIRKAGGCVYYHPDIWSDYHVRSTFGAFVRQYFRYGKSKTLITREHPGGVRLRHRVPLVVAAGVVLESLFVVVGWLPAGIVLFQSGVYLAAIAFVSSIICYRQARWRRYALVALVLISIHLSWTAGFLYGLISPPSRRGA